MRRLVVNLKPAVRASGGGGGGGGSAGGGSGAAAHVTQLRAAVDAIYGSRETPCTLEELFRWAPGTRSPGVPQQRGGRGTLAPPAPAAPPPRAAVRSWLSHALPPSLPPPARSAVESEVAAQNGGALHALLAEECQRKAAAEAAALAAAVALDSPAFLQHVVNLWEAYSSQLSLIRCGRPRGGARRGPAG